MGGGRPPTGPPSGGLPSGWAGEGRERGGARACSILHELYTAVNQMDLAGMPVLTQQQKRIVRASDKNDAKRYGGGARLVPLNRRAPPLTRQGNCGVVGRVRRLYAAKVRFANVDIPMKIPVAMFSEEVGDVRARRVCVHVGSLVSGFTHSVVHAGGGRARRVYVSFAGGWGSFRSSSSFPSFRALPPRAAKTGSWRF